MRRTTGILINAEVPRSSILMKISYFIFKTINMFIIRNLASMNSTNNESIVFITYCTNAFGIIIAAWK